LNPHAH